MAKVSKQQVGLKRNKTRHKFKKTSIGLSHNTKHNKYRGQGK